MDLFNIAIILLPFENLIFAPSRGWATISPILFFVYVLLNINKLGRVIAKEKTVIFFIMGVLCFQPVLFLINGFKPSSFIDNFITIILGMFFYFALVIRYDIYKKDFKKDGQKLYTAYFLSLIYGVIRILSFNYILPLKSLFILIEKRPYDRVQFSFTEPSFISPHMFGVLMLFTYFIDDITLVRKMKRLALMFCIINIIFGGSVRCSIDFLIFLVLYILRNIIKERKHIFRNIALLMCCVILVPIAVSSFPRLHAILNNGINSDGSGATRFFYIYTALLNLIHDPFNSIIGYGIGNMSIPYHNNFQIASLKFTNVYTTEIYGAAKSDSISSLFCMPVKITYEFGLIVLIIVLMYFIIMSKRKRIDIFVAIMTVWIYMQFDSYAFYSLWLFLFLVRKYTPERFGKSYFERYSNIPKI